MNEPLPLEASQTALVIIDLQKGIVARPTAPHVSSHVVQNAVALTRACRAKNVPVFLVHVGFSPDGKDRLSPIVDEPQNWGGNMPSDWSEFVPELEQEATDFVITKHQWSAFTGTELDLQLRRRGVTTILLCGISTNIGVESTARLAYELGYHQVFIEDAMSARTEEEHAHTVKTLFPRIGRVRITKDIVDALNT